MLARREYSRGELRDRLLAKGHAEAAVDAAVAALVAAGLVSDERYAEMLLTARRGRGVGPVRIRRELEGKGVDAGTIDRHLAGVEDDWLAELRRVRRKKFGAARPTDYTERARQARFLQYRGYTPEQIRRVLDTDDDNE